MTISEKEQNQFVYDSTFPSMRKKFDSIDVRTHDIKRAFLFINQYQILSKF